jgi:hypothetical protein
MRSTETVEYTLRIVSTKLPRGLSGAPQKAMKKRALLDLGGYEKTRAQARNGLPSGCRRQGGGG